MSSSDGLERLKNWHRAATPLICSASNLSSGKLVEIEVRVSAVTPSEVLLLATTSGDCEALEISMVKFSEVRIGTALALHLKFPSGKIVVLAERAKA